MALHVLEFSKHTLSEGRFGSNMVTPGQKHTSLKKTKLAFDCEEGSTNEVQPSLFHGAKGRRRGEDEVPEGNGTMNRKSMAPAVKLHHHSKCELQGKYQQRRQSQGRPLLTDVQPLASRADGPGGAAISQDELDALAVVCPDDEQEDCGLDEYLCRRKCEMQRCDPHIADPLGSASPSQRSYL
eukprot:TRINITY_DN48005_c0_g1_i1.p1 TRINITY_DN48005_c0_g1~~TRINITY_DN48005_c0_g1_i1.p1  ORF type:complete len:202 (-),score=27.00 TRINITY_DN48005_c0_g1_i1:200-748(-)